ncbi:MAG: HDOD domain-containing protein [Rhodoferax sp.]
MDLQSIVDPPVKLPAMPRVGRQLLARLGADDVSLAEIAAQIQADPALSAKLLRLANSAYFHVSRSIATVGAATQMLGLVMVRNLVVGHSMGAVYGQLADFDLPVFWRHGLYTACLSRWLAQQTGRDGDCAFTLGVLQGIGILHMHAAAPQAMQGIACEADMLSPRRAQVERATLGFHHGDVASALAQRWNFPPVLAESLRWIPLPLDAQPLNADAAWIHLAAWRARLAVLGAGSDDTDAPYPAQVAQVLAQSTGAVVPLSAQAMPDPIVLSQGLEGLFEG